jgi:hypothetical protein
MHAIQHEHDRGAVAFFQALKPDGKRQGNLLGIGFIVAEGDYEIGSSPYVLLS